MGRFDVGGSTAMQQGTVLTEVTAYGPALGNPATILSGRLVRFQVKFNF